MKSNLDYILLNTAQESGDVKIKVTKNMWLMSRGREGNRRSGVALAMHGRLSHRLVYPPTGPRPN